jgi:DNA-binding CsgD family transcriptional regulator
MLLVAHGYTYSEIGDALGLSARTVESHFTDGKRSIRARSRAEVTRWAVETKLLFAIAPETLMGRPSADGAH